LTLESPKPYHGFDWLRREIPEKFAKVPIPDRTINDTTVRAKAP